MPEYSVVGQRVNRVDALDKVTGKALYSADITLPDTLHGKVLRSPHAHARIRRLDTTRAQALDGIMAVITATDVPGQPDPAEYPNPMFPCLAWEKVTFAGQPVAAVAAIDPYIAEEALKLIDVDYEVLEPVTDVEAAMKPESALIYPNMYTQNAPAKPAKPSNVFWYMANNIGDIEAGFREADIVLENTFRTQPVHQGHLEPRASLAAIDLEGKITVWTDNQGIFTARELIAEYLKLPLNYVKVIPVEVGGAFGGKEHQQLSPLCALLAQKTGRPVRMVMTREEVFQATRPAAASVITLKMGATRDGRLTAASTTMIYDYGISTGMPGMGTVHFGSYTGLSPYRIPNYRIECYDVVTNKAPVGPYRAPTATQAAFAVESQMDLMAQALGMDPIEFRLKNAVVEGDTMVNGTPFGRIGFRETLERIEQYLSQRAEPTGENRGRGIACGLWPTGIMGSSAHINVNYDGTVILVVGSTDISGTRTTLAQMVAEEFGLPFEKVTIVTGDTETAPYSISSVGSMTTRSMGAAVCRACQDVKDQLCQRAASRLEVAPEDVEFANGRVQVKGAPGKSISFADLVAPSFQFSDSGPITGRGTGAMGEGTPVFAVQVADVEVDKETGKVKILSYAVAQDAGLAVNPTLVEGQMQGGVVQGIGWALNENYIFQNGVMQNTTLLDYRMPTATDVPFIDTMLVEVSSGASPLGIRGVGEPPIVPSLATIANAIHRATGVRFKQLPMTPETILNGIITQGKSPTK